MSRSIAALGALVILIWANASEESLAQDGASLVGPHYADERRCSELLGDLNDSPDRNALALNVATQICYVSRLADFLAATAPKNVGPSPGAPRSTGPADNPLDGARQSALTSLERASSRRDALLNEFAQTDPHEANELLKRLLGKPSPMPKG